jgi:hypothetical protein
VADAATAERLPGGQLRCSHLRLQGSSGVYVRAAHMSFFMGITGRLVARPARRSDLKSAFEMPAL